MPTKPTFPSAWFQEQLAIRGVSLAAVTSAAAAAGVCSRSTIPQWLYKGTMPSAYTWLWVCRFLEINPAAPWGWDNHPGPCPDMGDGGPLL